MLKKKRVYVKEPMIGIIIIIAVIMFLARFIAYMLGNSSSNPN